MSQTWTRRLARLHCIARPNHDGTCRPEAHEPAIERTSNCTAERPPEARKQAAGRRLSRDTGRVLEAKAAAPRVRCKEQPVSTPGAGQAVNFARYQQPYLAGSRIYLAGRSVFDANAKDIC